MGGSEPSNQADAGAASESTESCFAYSDAVNLLFTTKTCPNCTIAKSLLDSNNIKYKIIDGDENVDLVRAYDVRQAPTLVVTGGNGNGSNGNGFASYTNAANIKKYVQSCLVNA